ncbi:hypothetical protein AURDEDRAFT_128667 [Auricularia subglabra TFB-10046 SS5]|nr:hypothetical protein AURDEDRAFT_128667 [Auricularia subglabra TFB-10046 SS5]
MSLPQRLFLGDAPALRSVQLEGNFFGPPSFSRRPNEEYPSVFSQAELLEISTTDAFEIFLSMSGSFERLSKLHLTDGRLSRSRSHIERDSVIPLGHPRFPTVPSPSPTKSPLLLSHLTLRLSGRILTPLLEYFSLNHMASLHIRFYPLVFATLRRAEAVSCLHASLRCLSINKGVERSRFALCFGDIASRHILVDNVPDHVGATISGPAFAYITLLSMHEHAVFFIDIPSITSLVLQLDAHPDPEKSSVLGWARVERYPLLTLPRLCDLTVYAPVLRQDVTDLEVLALINKTIKFSSKSLQRLKLNNISCSSGSPGWKKLCRAACDVTVAPVCVKGQLQSAQRVVKQCI